MHFTSRLYQSCCHGFLDPYKACLQVGDASPEYIEVPLVFRRKEVHPEKSPIPLLEVLLSDQAGVRAGSRQLDQLKSSHYARWGIVKGS